MLRKVCALAFSLALATLGSAQNYSNTPTVINAGVVVLANDVKANNLAWTPYSAAPFALYNLDGAASIKPAGWSFQNPMAPGTVSIPAASAWASISSETGGNFATPNAGDPVAKRDAAYWAVSLDNLGDADLSKFNLLLVAPSQLLSMTPLEREMLRRFVDGGGVLWVDTGALPPSPNSVDQINVGPVSFSIANSSGGSGNINADLTQPILTNPYPLTSADISLLDSQSTAYVTASVTALVNITGSGPGDIFTLQPYANNGDAFPTEMYTRIGDGFVVVTARGAALELNRPAAYSSYSANVGYYALDGGVAPVLGPDGVVAGKLVINMLSLQSEARMAQGGSRKANSLGTDLHPPLLQRFNLENAGMVTPQTTAQMYPTAMPVFYKDLMFVTAGSVLYAYDVFPPENLDGTGNEDDGIIDYSVGAPYDLVWKATVLGAARLSTPACTEVAHAAPGVPKDEVWVLDDQGTLHVFNALPKNSSGIGFGGNLINEPEAAPAMKAPGGAASFLSYEMPAAPTIHEGYVFVADSQSSGLIGNSQLGRIWIADTRTMNYLMTPSTNQPWVIGGTAAATLGNVSLGDIAGSPIVGYIPIADNSGGQDLVIYVPVRPTNVGLVSTPALMASIWLGARGESPNSPPTINGDSLVVQSRANTHGGMATYTDPNGEFGEGGAPDPRTLKLTVIQNGQPWNQQLMSQYFKGDVSDDGSGNLTFDMQLGEGAAFQNLMSSTNAATVVSVRLDYWVDWGKSGLTSNLTNKLVRGSAKFLDVTPSVRTVVGNLAMSPRGTVYAVVADPNGATGGEAGGSFYAIREVGFGQFNYVTRYDLYPQHNMVLNQALPTEYDEVLYDKDPINQYVNTADWVSQRSLRQMSNFVFTGGPTVRNGEVFVSAQATKSFVLPGGPTIPNVPVTILMAFAAEPLSPEIPVGSWPDGSTLVQPDFARSNPLTLNNPSQYGTLSNTTGYAGYSYDPVSGYLQFSNLADNGQGSPQNCLSVSQPVILRRPQQPDFFMEPNKYTNRWSPLLWYQVFEGSTNWFGSSPTVTGDSVFLGMSSAVPSLLTNPNEPALKFQGLINATTAQIAPNSPWLQAQDWADGTNGDYRAWQTQLWTIPAPNTGALNNPAPGTGPNPFIVWPQMAGIQGLQDYVTRLNQTTLSNSSTTYAIAAGEGALAAVGNLGIYTFDRAQILVCDEGRLARFDSSGNPIQIMHGYTSGGSDDASNAGTYHPLVRPTRAIDLDESTSLVVDTGASRVIKVDTSGHELRALDTFQFDPNYGNPTGNALYAGIWPQEGGFLNESLSLKSPADVLTFSGYTALTGAQSTQQVTNQQPIEYWTHYVVADQGNNRLVELVDRYSVDPSTLNVGPPITLQEYVVKPDGTLDQALVPQLGVCLWHSPAAQSGRGYSYNSINRVWIPSEGTFTGRYVYVAGIGNAATAFDQNIGQSNVINPPAVTANGNPGVNGQGGIVIFDNTLPNFAQVYNYMTQLPNLKDMPFWDFGQGKWDTNTPLNVTNEAVSGTPGTGVVPFSNVNSVTCKVYAPFANGAYGAPVIQIMVADSDGVFEVNYVPDGEPSQAGPAALPVNWYMPGQVYRTLRNIGSASPLTPGSNPNAFNPTYAKRLDNGDVLIVNGYAGTYWPNNTGAFNGEVLEVNGQTGQQPGAGFNLNNPNLGFGLASINYVLGPIQKVRGLVLPSFADRR